MQPSFEFVDDIPDKEAFENLMVEFYRIMGAKLMEAGGPELSAEQMASGTMAHVNELLPPHGQTLLAWSESGSLLGCGVIRKIRADAGEFKRMYIRPEAQGLGLGRKLFQLRIEKALEMGLKHIYADTIKGNIGMLNMYEKQGFKYIERYPENANPPELEEFFVFLEKDIS